MAESPSTKAPAALTTVPEDTEDKRQAAEAALAQGKRHLLVKDFTSAVASFKEATETLVELYGEQAPECGDTCYYYGLALLEQAREEAGVLGPELEGANSQEEEEEDEDGDEPEESQEEEGEKKEEGEAVNKEEGEEVNKEEGEEVNKDAEKKEGSDKPETAGEGEEGKAEEEEEEEVSTLQCAWEWLDAARLILDKQKETPALAKRLADVRLSLGQVCMESEDYEGAFNEFHKCLAIQEQCLAKDDRSLAETHHQLGLLHSLSDNFEDAVTHYSAVVEVIQLKIKNLKAKAEEEKTWTKERKEQEAAECKKGYTREEEIEDLELLLPDIQEKIVDMEEMMAASRERLQETAKELLARQGLGLGTSGAVFAQARDSDSPASVSRDAKKSSATPIVCQVRPKRKPEESTERTAEHKKPRLEQRIQSGAEGSVGFFTPQDMTKQPSQTLPKPIAVKRKVTQNGGGSSTVSSSINAASKS